MTDVVALNKPKQDAAERRSPPAGDGAEPEILNAHLQESIEPERRRTMVAEAAYFHAEHRGFEPGHEMEDWLAAETQIDAALRLSYPAAPLREKKTQAE